MNPNSASYEPTTEELLAVFDSKYRRHAQLSWGPKARLAFGYFTPDDCYEAVVGKLLQSGSDWCDVGCGRNIFPDNPSLARTYTQRCSFVYGIDPDENVLENQFVHDRFQGLVEDCSLDRQFDLVTLRMVAEHIADPTAALSKVAALLKPSGHAIVYTPHKWAPMSIAAAVVPFRLHNPLKRLIWASEARDTFPTKYRLNTFNSIETHAKACGLSIAHYTLLDDCRMTNSFKAINRFELLLWKSLSRFGIRYPETCILAILKKS